MDILTIGEVLIDLTQTGKDARGIPQFAANPGGAPANLAVAASRLGAQTAFIGKVGADAFGRYLKEVLAENKVDVSGMAVDADHPTTMAVVSVDATGERDFSFYRSANADVMLCKEDISDEALKAAKIVHFGSVSLTADPSRTATLDAAARAKKLGATITYDPNYRANLWKNKEDAIAQMKAPLPLVVALDQVQDPGNVGTLCRTLYALGGAGVILPRHNSAYLGPAAHRAAAGALERLPVARVTNLAHALDEAEEAGFSIYGAGCGPDAADAFEHAMQLPAVLVLGNEDKGLRPGVAKRCGRMLRIPLARKFDSLNVAQAGAILLGLAAMRRQG